MRKKILVTIFLFSAVLCFAREQKPFVIFIPSYNNETVCRRNIISALNQNYDNFRVVYINDCSSDRTSEFVKKAVLNRGAVDRVTVVDNPVRRKALANFYHGIHEYVDDEEIVVVLDGDDALAGPHVLSYLNKVYSHPQKEIWLTYGQYQEMRSKNRGFCCPYPKDVIRENRFRSYQHGPSHLRTFYGWLFKKIRKEDLMKNGNFFAMTYDLAMMFPMLEMARDHFLFIPRILYSYNDDNPISDHRVNQKLQRATDLYIRSLPRYTPLKTKEQEPSYES